MGRKSTRGHSCGTASRSDRTLVDCGRFFPPEAKTAEAMPFARIPRRR